jgi:hypothetical protein
MSISKTNNRKGGRSKTEANFNRRDFQAYQGQTQFDLGDFLLTEDSVVYVNGSPVNQNIYSGIGTTILQFHEEMNEYDQVLIIG